MAIDVFFTGLMLICLEGQPGCPVGDYGNTAWVPKADGASMPCKWPSATKTELDLLFPKSHFDYSGDWAKKNCKPYEYDTSKIECPLPPGDICVLPRPMQFGKGQKVDSSLRWLPRLDEVDRRFKALDYSFLNDTGNVPARVHFPTGGVIGAGARWPPGGTPTLWERSDDSKGGALPRELSDRFRVTYQMADELEVMACGNKPWIVLDRKSDVQSGEVVLRNSADQLVPDIVNGYDNLAYLLWYYPLGVWDTADKKCPAYTGKYPKTDAVLLCCKRMKDKDNNYIKCSASDGIGARDTVHWPPMLGPWF